MTESNFGDLKSKMVCTDDVNMNTLTYTQAKQYMQEDKCASYVLQSQAGNYRVKLFILFVLCCCENE